MKAMTYRQKLSQIHAALGHARRLRLIEILSDAPKGLTFEELSHRSSINQSTLGHHVKVLLGAGFLNKTIKGPYSIYTYDPAPMALILTERPLVKAA